MHSPIRASWKLDAALLCLLVSAGAAIAFIYTASERYFYFWDYATYQGIAEDTAAAFQASFGDGIRGVWGSLADDYNRLFALPLVPIAMTFGLSRTVFITGLAVLYQLPLALAMGAIATEVFRGGGRSMFWGTSVLTLLIPTTWAPTLRGYPDAGGAAFVLLAVWLHLRNAGEHPRLWRAAMAGVSLACGMLFRRHYAYAAVAFFAAAAIHGAVWAMVSGATWRSQGLLLWRACFTLAVMGAATTATLLMSPAFVEHMLAQNYFELYRSYLRSPMNEFVFFGDFFGGGVWMLSACGWLLAWRSRAASHVPASFVLLLGCLSLLIWVFLVRQTGPHYGFHAAILVVLGLTSLATVASAHVQRAGAARVVLWAGVASLVGLNLFLSFSPRRRLADFPARRLFAASYPPLVRRDYAEVLRLLEYLHTVAGPTAPIYVGGSSWEMNSDMLARADRAHGRPGRMALSIMYAPQIDSRDWYPVEELIRAQFVVITSPFQGHLDPTEQDVVRVVHTAFADGWEIARDFQSLPERFRLAGDVEATVFERTHPTAPATALRTFDEQRVFLGPQPPGTQPDWIALTPESETIHQPPDARRVRFLPATVRQVLLYVGAGDWREKQFTAAVHFATPTATRVRIALSAIDSAGNPGGEKPTSQVVRPAAPSADAEVSMPTPVSERPYHRLLLTIEPLDGGSLPAEIRVQSLGAGR